MPYLELTLNGKKLAVGGDERLDVLSLALVATKHWPHVSLHLGGMRRLASGRTEHLSWSSSQLHSHDQLRVMLLDKAVADQVATQEAASVSSAKELLGKHERIEGDEHKRRTKTPSQTLRFDIEFSDSERVCATGTEDTLQLVATWLGGRGGCKVDIDSITVLDDGTTKGQRWAERILRPGEWFEVTPFIQ